jgi:branched-chain amino acid transport system substrate-binding protein
MKRTNRGIGLLLGSFLAAALLVCFGRESMGAKGALPPLKIYVAGAQSGDLAPYGIPTLRAAEMVAELKNASGGAAGRKIVIVPEDDGCKPEMAVNVADKIVGEKADIVLGHTCSGATNAAMGVYRNARILVMSPSATSPSLTHSRAFPNFFRTIASDDEQARVQVNFALNVLKLRKIAVIHDKGDYGKGLAEYARAFISADKRAQAVLFEGITPGALDYSAVVQKIRRSGAEAVIYGGYMPEASKIVTQMRKKGMNTIFISDDGVKDETFIKVAGPFCEGVYATGPKDTTRNPMAVKAVEAHKKKYGSAPGSFFLNAYAAMLALANAVEKAGSTDVLAVSAALRKEWVETPLGRIRFDDKGDTVGAGFSMYRVEKGAYVELKK